MLTNDAKTSAEKSESAELDVSVALCMTPDCLTIDDDEPEVLEEEKSSTAVQIADDSATTAKNVESSADTVTNGEPSSTTASNDVEPMETTSSDEADEEAHDEISAFLQQLLDDVVAGEAVVVEPIPEPVATTTTTVNTHDMSDDLLLDGELPENILEGTDFGGDFDDILDAVEAN